MTMCAASGLNEILLLLVDHMEPPGATGVVESLVAAMKEETNNNRLSDLSKVLLRLALRLEAGDVTGVVESLVERMEVENDAQRLLILNETMSALTNLEKSSHAESWAIRRAKRLGAVLEQHLDTYRLCYALSALTDRLGPAATARSVDQLAGVMEKETGISEHKSLSDALAKMASRVAPNDAAQSANRLVVMMEQETNMARVRNLNYVLSALTARLDPEARQVRLFGLFYWLLERGIRGREGKNNLEADERKIALALLHPLTTNELVDVLKWPFCVGESEKLVLAELGTKFEGNLRKFIELAPSLGITSLANPPRQPTLETVRQELGALNAIAETSSDVKPPPPQGQSAPVDVPAKPNPPKSASLHQADQQQSPIFLLWTIASYAALIVIIALSATRQSQAGRGR